jgi:hypothetical protein
MSRDSNFELQPSVGDDFAWKQNGSVVPVSAPPPLAPATSDSFAPLPTAWSPPPAERSGLAGVFRGVNQWLGSIIQRFTLPEDDGPVDPFGKLVASTPPWAISLIVHFSFMILLGLAVFGVQTVATYKETPIQMDLAERKDNEIYAESLGQQLDDPSIKMSNDGLEPSKDAIAALATSDLPKVDQPLIGPPVLEPSANGTLPVGPRGRRQGRYAQGVRRHQAYGRRREGRFELARAAATVARFVEPDGPLPRRRAAGK